MPHPRAVAAVFAVVITWSAVAAGQAPARRPQKVFLSGENPCIALRDRFDGAALTRASFWRIHWSPVGTGHVCFAIELVWRALQEPGLVDILPGSRQTNPFGITYLRIPAGSAEVVINGTAAPGASVPSGSFLAFGETWIK
jgi:hypothetical protein